MKNQETETSGSHGSALLIIDVVNHFRFPGGKALLARAEAIVDPVLALRAAVENAGGPIIYVNDNFGEWHSDRARLIEQVLAGGNEVIRRLMPRDTDYFIIKPQFSGFHATNLPALLRELGIDRLILTGVATDICILFTAADAHMRGFGIWIPEDAVAAENDARGAWALEIMVNAMTAETRSTRALHLQEWDVEGNAS